MGNELSPAEQTLVDTNFFVAIGDPENWKFQQFRKVVERSGVVLSVPERVQHKLAIHPNERRLSTALDEGWAEIVSAPPLRASEAIEATDHARQTIADLTGQDEHDVEKTDTIFAGLAVQYLASADRRRTDCERFLYYNTGYVVLSRLVKAVSGRPFPAFVEETVFQPLGMERASFEPDTLDGEGTDVMTPYVPDEEGHRAASFPDHPAFLGPGGLLVSVEDLGRFLAAQTTGGPELDDTRRRQMHDPVVTTARRIDGTEQGYGYGWQTRPFGSDRLVGHSGNTGVSAGYVGFLQERGLGVAVGCNAPPERSPANLATVILARLTDRDPASVSPSRALDRNARRVTGRYESYRGIQTAVVEWTGSQFTIEHGTPFDERVVRFEPESLAPAEYEFSTLEDNGTRTTVEFFLGDDGVEMLLDRILFRRRET